MHESSHLQDGIYVTKYSSRHWAVWIGQELVAVTVYLKGATRVAELLRGLPKEWAPPTSNFVFGGKSELAFTDRFRTQEK